MLLLSVNMQWMEDSPGERPFFDHNCSNITLDKLPFTSTLSKLWSSYKVFIKNGHLRRTT